MQRTNFDQNAKTLIQAKIVENARFLHHRQTRIFQSSRFSKGNVTLSN